MSIVSGTKTSDIPNKLKGFDTFVQCMTDIILVGTDKYSGKEKDKMETIDILPQIFGEEGYRTFVLADLTKRIFRLKNQLRERDLFKIGVWCFLLWKRYFFHDNADGLSKFIKRLEATDSMEEKKE